MLYVLERIEKITEELKKYIYEEKLSIDDYQCKIGNYIKIEDVDNSDLEWKPFKKKDFWGGEEKHAWFRTKVIVPRNFDKEVIALNFYTDKQGWDATNPQFILYVNGELIQGLDVNHREVIISKAAKAGEEYTVDLHAYSGTEEGECRLFGELVTIKNAVRELYYNIQVPVWVCEKLDKEDKRRIDMLTVLNDTINILDLRKPKSKEFYDSIYMANKFMEKEFYEKLCGHEDMIATCVGHTHIDVAWLWTLAQTKEKSVRSFSTVLKLMEEYPEYIFMSSQPQLYKFVKERNPEVYEKIKKKVAEGVWETEGAMWLEADCNVTSGESLVRQILFGTRFFDKEFGTKNEVLWLPDVFGYSAALPQILKKSDINYFMTTKIAWNQFNKMPYDTFMWQGIDGTEVLTHFITTKEPYADKDTYFTTYNGELHPGAVIGAWNRYQQKEINNDVLISYGFGDGGGGTTKEMIEAGRRMNKGIPGCPKVEFGNSKNYFRKLEDTVKGNKRLPRWVGELYLEYHRGTYTSMGRNKRYNRKSEFLYQDIENLSALAMTLGNQYPQEDINKAWEVILLNQFHDILPGSAIKEVYDVSKEQYEGIISEGKQLVKKAMKNICRNIDLNSKSVVVFNTLSFNRNDLVKFDMPENMNSILIKDDNENELPCQLIEEFGRKKVIFFAKDVPAKGYKVFRLEEGKCIENKAFIIDDGVMENDFFKIQLDRAANITSIFDKANNREILKTGERANKLVAFEDKPMCFDNWDIDIYYEEKSWEINEVEKLEIVEDGPVRAAIKITKKFLDSEIIQNMYIYKDIKRIDFDTYVDWKESQILLKAAFPVDIHTSKASYDIQFGNVERPTHRNTSWDTARFEVCAHKWADLSEDGYGVSLLNDCKYGYDIKDGVMRLTLLKSGIDPNKEADKEEHRFCYSLYPHEGDWKKGNTVGMAYNLNVPLYSVVEDAHKGSLSEKLSMIKFDNDNVVLETIKKAEDSDEIIIRLFECYNRKSNVTLEFYKELEKVTECNLMEKELVDIDVNNKSFTFKLKPYEIKTFKLKVK